MFCYDKSRRYSISRLEERRIDRSMMERRERINNKNLPKWSHCPSWGLAFSAQLYRSADFIQMCKIIL